MRICYVNIKHAWDHMSRIQIWRDFDLFININVVSVNPTHHTIIGADNLFRPALYLEQLCNCQEDNQTQNLFNYPLVYGQNKSGKRSQLAAKTR